VSRCTGSTPDECSGSCVNKSNDPQNCGTCGHTCTYPNADANCAAGQCSMGSCRPDYGDCTNAPGCETLLTTSTDCGQCGKPCGAPGDVASCATGTCIVTCQAAPEDCFNNKDDDCDNLIDCGDPNCAPVAVCEPVVAGLSFGTIVDPQTSCPVGFGGDGTMLHASLDASGSCSGCSCTPTTTSCTPVKFTLYGTAEQCNADMPSGPMFEATQLNTSCAIGPGAVDHHGIRAQPTVTQACAMTPPVLPMPTWGTNSKFCAATLSGAGCGSGSACVPRPPISSCLMATGSATCPSGFAQQSSYTGYADTRACNCSCSATGGSCDSVWYYVGNEGTTCADFAGYRLDSSRVCDSSGSLTAIYYRFSGSPTNPTGCSTQFNPTGTVTPTGLHTLCCR
jgi:hypothetical protein